MISATMATTRYGERSAGGAGSSPGRRAVEASAATEAAASEVAVAAGVLMTPTTALALAAWWVSRLVAAPVGDAAAAGAGMTVGMRSAAVSGDDGISVGGGVTST